MIIKNNYNSRDVNPLNDYDSIGKGSHSLDKELKREKEGFIKDNMNNPVLRDLRKEEKLEDEKHEDKWEFFK